MNQELVYKPKTISMKKLVLHIPHASVYFPNKIGYVVSEERLQKELTKMTDWYTDELFANPIDLACIVPFSRLFCDVERFKSDELEPMSQFGMGFAYTHCENGQLLRQLTPAEREEVAHFYDAHHNQLNQVVGQELKENGSVLIVDCHSFPNVPSQCNFNQRVPRPDFNIGTDPDHTSEALSQFCVRFFEEKGFTVGLDWPYSGTMVPNDFWHQDQRVKSVMLEINRRLYLEPGTNQKSNQFEAIKDLTQSFLKALRDQF